eukprot:Sspe_Gene.73501::Locus_44438_Transcript_1_1_Confidence_1.000_Length_1358::g.73501::m.73501
MSNASRPTWSIDAPPYYKAKRSLERFPHNLDTHEVEDIKRYFRNHAIRGLWCDEGAWDGEVEILDWGVKARFKGAEGSATSIYVFRACRGQGHMSRYLADHPDEVFVTAPDCDVEEFFKAKKVPHRVIPSPPYLEYEMVSRYYGDAVTDRTGVHMINHIDEGLFILNTIGASEDAKRAYCLHPVVQGDPDLATFFSSPGCLEAVDKRVLALALEYRNIANAHLSYHPEGEDAFNLSPLPEVNDMLIADKIQNRKDFRLYHMASHPRSARLAEYFEEWLRKLGVGERRVEEITADLLQRTGGEEGARLAFRPSGGKTTLADSTGLAQVARNVQKQHTGGPSTSPSPVALTYFLCGAAVALLASRIISQRI